MVPAEEGVSVDQYIDDILGAEGGGDRKGTEENSLKNLETGQCGGEKKKKTKYFYLSFRMTVKFDP
ncbi:hypothetical protein FK515_29560 [Klebsiella pneumoniae]|nr:hypothetical protein [Klebsiella pneumoniae]